MASGLIVASARRTHFRRSKRVIDLAHARRQPAAQLRHAGGGGAGDDDFDVGQARFQRPDQLGAKIDFANADRMQPEDAAVGQRLLERRIIVANRWPKSRCQSPRRHSRQK
jgi:hypothetical protein